jgi:hypothetical protein
MKHQCPNCGCQFSDAVLAHKPITPLPEPARSSEEIVRVQPVGRPLAETPSAETKPEWDDEENIAMGAAAVMCERKATPGFTPKAVWLQRRLRWGWIRASRLLAEIVRRADEGERPTAGTQARAGTAADKHEP